MTQPSCHGPSPSGSTSGQDFSQRALQTYLIGVYLGINAIRDAYLCVEAPDCVHMKTQFVQGNHDWLSTLSSVSGYHRIANTALHPVDMTGSREEDLEAFLLRMAEEPEVTNVMLTSMPMAFITGADYERLCENVNLATGKPLIHIKGKSLSTDWIDGYAEFLVSLAKQLDLSGGTLDDNKVAIVGNLFDRNEGDARANVIELRRLLTGLGLEVASIWLDGGNFDELYGIRDAGTIISLPYGWRAAKRVSRRTGAQLAVCEVPFGADATSRFVRQVAEATGKQKEAEALVAAEEASLAPRVAALGRFGLADSDWAFVGDPFLAQRVNEVAGTFGTQLRFAAITNLSHHVRDLEERLEGIDIIIAARQNTLSNFISSRLQGERPVGLFLAHSDGQFGDHIPTVPFGFPSYYRHHMTERPVLGYRGFQAFIDDVASDITRRKGLGFGRPSRRGGGDGDGGGHGGRIDPRPDPSGDIDSRTNDGDFDGALDPRPDPERGYDPTPEKYDQTEGEGPTDDKRESNVEND